METGVFAGGFGAHVGQLVVLSNSERNATL